MIFVYSHAFHYRITHTICVFVCTWNYYSRCFAYLTLFCPLEIQSQCNLFLFWIIVILGSLFWLCLQRWDSSAEDKLRQKLQGCHSTQTKTDIPGIISIIPVHWLLSSTAVMSLVSDSAFPGLWISDCLWKSSTHKLGTPKTHCSSHCPRGRLFWVAGQTWSCRPPN